MLKGFELKKSFICSNLFYYYIKRLFYYYIKQIDSMLPCVCSVIDHRQMSKCGKNISDTRLSPCVPLVCSYHILMSSVIYY